MVSNDDLSKDYIEEEKDENEVGFWKPVIFYFQKFFGIKKDFVTSDQKSNRIFCLLPINQTRLDFGCIFVFSFKACSLTVSQ